jgi:hypothetical protein
MTPQLFSVYPWEFQLSASISKAWIRLVKAFTSGKDKKFECRADDAIFTFRKVQEDSVAYGLSVAIAALVHAGGF